MANTAVLKPKSRDLSVNTGLSDKYCAAMAKSLSAILASTYHLVIKSHIYHWNVVGPLFKPLHELTEEHYNTLFKATDIIAERIRALGHLAPSNVGDAAKFAPASGDISQLTAEDMVRDLIEDHEAACRAMREAGTSADENDDLVTTDMLTDRLTFHEKALWMLKAIIAK
jgi:starvation-inducible DNA-binding protein